MSDLTAPDPNDQFGQQRSVKWENLSDEVKTQALARALQLLAQRGFQPFSSEAITSALGPDQLKLIAQNIDLASQLSDEQLETVAEHIAENRLGATPNSVPEEGTSMESSSKPLGDAASDFIFARPAATLYGVSLALFMLALYLSSPLIALIGVGTLLITILHYAS